MSQNSDAPLVLIGAGGHAKVLVDIIRARGRKLLGYVDDENKPWLAELGVPRMQEQELPAALAQAELVIGFVGLSCAALQRRLEIMRNYLQQGARLATLIHPSAVVSDRAQLATGVQVLPGAVINAQAVLGVGAVINSGAVVEHDANIGAGVHLAPRAVALGGTTIGECAYVGSGAVVIQNVSVAPAEFIKALAVRGQ